LKIKSKLWQLFIVDKISDWQSEKVDENSFSSTITDRQLTEKVKYCYFKLPKRFKYTDIMFC
jgi:hypothetical protein